MQTFIPPSFNLALNWTADLLHPFLLKAVQNIDEVEISDEDKNMLRSLRDDRLLFFTNHPSTAEPPIVYKLGNIMGARFKYMASRQVFDWTFGLTGKVISNLGAYSIIAGINDREALKTSRAVLAEPSGKLVLFPEGEPTSGENDSLMPFQSGVAQIPFWALDDARKQDPDADITILSGFMKYIIKGPPRETEQEIINYLAVLERKIGVNPGKRNLLRRFLHFGKVLLEQAEKEYNIPMASEKDFEYRIGRVRHAILDGVAEKMKLKTYDKNADAIMKLRALWAVVEMLMIEYPDEKLPKLTDKELDWAHRELVKAFDLIVIKKEYLVSYPTPERFFEWLTRFESYVLGKKPRALGGEPSHLPRRAVVTFAKPFKLSEYYPKGLDKAGKKKALADILERLRADMQRQLDLSKNLTTPIVEPYDVGDEI